MNDSDRFWQKVDTSGSCWEWTAAKTPKGYGQFRYGGKLGYAHRFSAEQAGHDTHGRVVDHICHNASCVRPEHLRSVESKQNSENLSGAHRDNQTGVRGVSWDKRAQGYQARVYSAGKRVFKRFRSLADAEAWVIERRCEMFTHNDLDREPV